jgi:MFS family permease
MEVETAGPSIWRQGAFWRLFVPSIGVGLQQQMVTIALPLLVYQASSSTLAMNVVRALGYVPYLLLAFVIGALVDQTDKKRWLIGAASLQVASLTALALVFGAGPVMMLVYALVLFLSTANYTYFNARTSALKVALRPSDLGPAAAAFISIGQAFQMLGPALAGVLLLFPSPAAALWAAAGVALFSLTVLLGLDVDRREDPTSESLPVRIAEGWRALRANRPLWLFTFVIAVTNSSESMLSITVLQKAQALGLSGAEIGVLFSAAGGVGMAGSLAAPWLRPFVGLGPLSALAVLVTGLCALGAAYASTTITLAAVLCISSFSIMIYTVMVSTLRQETTPVAVIGRVTGVTGSLYQLAAPFAIVGAGFLAENAGLHPVFLVIAVTGGLMSAVILTNPTLRALR